MVKMQTGWGACVFMCVHVCSRVSEGSCQVLEEVTDPVMGQCLHDSVKVQRSHWEPDFCMNSVVTDMVLPLVTVCVFHPNITLLLIQTTSPFSSSKRHPNFSLTFFGSDSCSTLGSRSHMLLIVWSQSGGHQVTDGPATQLREALNASPAVTRDMGDVTPPWRHRTARDWSFTEVCHSGSLRPWRPPCSACSPRGLRSFSPTVAPLSFSSSTSGKIFRLYLLLLCVQNCGGLQNKYRASPCPGAGDTQTALTETCGAQATEGRKTQKLTRLCATGH